MYLFLDILLSLLNDCKLCVWGGVNECRHSKWLEVTDRARVTRDSEPPDTGAGSSAKGGMYHQCLSHLSSALLCTSQE